jgi:hypothetical protein
MGAVAVWSQTTKTRNGEGEPAGREGEENMALLYAKPEFEVIKSNKI